MKICCSYLSYDVFKMFNLNESKVYACKNDVSYGSLKLDSFLFQHSNKLCSFSEMIEDINVETKLEIWFNSNNACEYCNFLYILYYLPVCEIYMIDTGASIQNEYGILTVFTTYMVPINYVETYKKLAQKLTLEMSQNYKKTWETLYKTNKQLRYVKNKSIYSVAETYFDEQVLKLPIYDLMEFYGLSEDWIKNRKRILITKEQ